LGDELDQLDHQQKRFKRYDLYRVYKLYTIALFAHTRTRGSISLRSKGKSAQPFGPEAVLSAASGGWWTVMSDAFSMPKHLKSAETIASIAGPAESRRGPSRHLRGLVFKGAG
jgi:hypothetical protein